MSIKTAMLTIPSLLKSKNFYLKSKNYFLLYSGVCECTVISELFGGEFCMNANYFVYIIGIEETLSNTRIVQLKKTVGRGGNFCWICVPRDCEVS